MKVYDTGWWVPGMLCAHMSQVTSWRWSCNLPTMTTEVKLPTDFDAFDGLANH
jgi:hypothetical protein